MKEHKESQHDYRARLRGKGFKRKETWIPNCIEAEMDLNEFELKLRRKYKHVLREEE